MSAQSVHVAWFARLLAAAEQRQRRAGTYRGDDDLRALHVPASVAFTALDAITSAPRAPWPADLGADWETLPAWRLDALFSSLVGDAPPSDDATREASRFVCLAALLPELEPRLRPMIAVLQDDPAPRHATVALAIELAAACAITASAVRAAVHPSGLLMTFGLVRAHEVEGRPSLLDHLLVADEWLVREVAGGPHPAEDATTWQRVGAGVAGGLAQPPATTPVAIHGADHGTQAELAGAAYGVDLVLRVAPGAAAAELTRAARLAAARAAVLVVDLASAADLPAIQSQCERLSRAGSRVVVSVAHEPVWLPPARWFELRAAPPATAARRARWQDVFSRHGLDADAPTLDAVAATFTIGLEAIEEAGRFLAAGDGRADADRVAAAARRASWRDLSSVARHVAADAGWADLVVPESTRRQLVEVAGGIRARAQVMDAWGYGGRPGSRGMHVLFAGPSGTGKTLAARVIAAESGLALWIVDLARVVDKYLGETEKAIDRVLRAAEDAQVLLVFDEADALFGRRGDVREARDRWANVEVAYLLQRLEDHDGVTALTTNMAHHLDEAFARRLNHRVEFTLPDASARRRLWRLAIPGDAPLADPDDLDVVADRFELAGGGIRTAATNAAYDAAARSQSIALDHLVRASVRELAKAGRAPTRADLGELASLLAGPDSAAR